MTSQQRTLSPAETIDWLRLIRSENVGPVTFHRLIDRFGSAARALDALPELARRGGRTRVIAIPSPADARHELDAAHKAGAHVLACVEPGYPPALRPLDDAPPLLYVRGNPHLLSRPTIAVVGARNASLGGCRIAREMAAELAAAGMTVVSGMARGIDTAAHEGALNSGTVAVLAGGVDVVYPPENGRLYDSIAAQGAVLSEMPPGLAPQASHFPRRNRIISGLSLAVVVVEATPRSGSLITARLAAEQGREVLAVPGSPLDPRSHGPNRLIRDGAALVESAADVLEVVAGVLHQPLAEPSRDGFGAAPPPTGGAAELAEARRLIGTALGSAPVVVDEIVRQCQLSPSVVAMVLLELDLAGRLERHPGNKVSLLR